MDYKRQISLLKLTKSLKLPDITAQRHVQTVCIYFGGKPIQTGGMPNDANNMSISNCSFVITPHFVVVVLTVFWTSDSPETKRKYLNILSIE